jgi:hypothetical protein
MARNKSMSDFSNPLMIELINVREDADKYRQEYERIQGWSTSTTIDATCLTLSVNAINTLARTNDNGAPTNHNDNLCLIHVEEGRELYNAYAAKCSRVNHLKEQYGTLHKEFIDMVCLLLF